MRRTLFALVALLAACTRNGTEGDDGPTCEGTPVDAPFDVAAPNGVVPADVAARIPATESVDFTYADGAVTTLTLAFTAATTATYTDLEPVYPDGSTIDIGIECDDVVSLGVDFTLTTGDGVFDEAFTSEAVATADALGALHEIVAFDAIAGAFEVTEFIDVETYDDGRVQVSVGLTDTGATAGQITGDVWGEDECADDDTCTAWDMGFDVGTWGPVSE